MRRDDWVDFHAVPDSQIAIHESLLNWARWVRVRPHGWQVSPMFRLFRSNWRQWHSPVLRDDTNVPEAVDMESAVAQLPEKHREAIRWSYYWATLPPPVARECGRVHDPLSMARRLGVSKQGLSDLVRVARTMLVNRMGQSVRRTVKNAA